MERVNAVLAVLNGEALDDVIKSLNLDKANLVAIVSDKRKAKFFTLGERKIPIFSFTQISAAVNKCKKFLWLLGGHLSDTDELGKLKKFLQLNGVPKANIVNLEALTDLSRTWLANVHHVEEHGADFFATGDEYMRDGLNLKLIPCVHENKNFSRGGANLAFAEQTLQQSYLTAKRIFERVKRGTIKFVLIGLTPHSFHLDEAENFFECQDLLNEATEPEKADLNFDALKATFPKIFSANVIAAWNDTSFSAPADVVEKNIQILKDYIKLCLDNGARPVGVVFPVSTAARKNFDAELLKNFRGTIRQLEDGKNFFCVDMFDLAFDYERFRDLTHLNPKGMLAANSFLAMKLCERKIIPAESFCDMTYEYFFVLSKFAHKDSYNLLLEKIFEATAQQIRRKDKIKLGFVVYLSAQWSGDELYNLFANDKRFETTIFLCKRLGGSTDNELFQEDFLRGVKQFKSHGLNVIPVKGLKAKIPAQDVIILLTPYFAKLPNVFKPAFLKAKTLVTHIPYSFDIAIRPSSYYNLALFRIAWKIFFSSVSGREVYAKNNFMGMPRGLFSGYPRMDIFFDKKTKFNFDWKTAQPDAKKIIWAPHWSILINNAISYATFRWNYKFMYEFAKAHPETSWVVKPHPGLFFSAVTAKIFPTVEAFEKYLQKWNDLPNAQVYTGAYYQAIFATSDGMIHDSGSFLAEYQFVDKPMIFLTREGGLFNELGHAIRSASYLVDGKDLDAIAATMQRVFIEGDDYKAAERREVFDKYLNYPKFNGMSASDFIYKSIADELKEVSS
ncbi:MAG: hypothetical protein IJQ82_07780 [Selenomonadaceae bacterium]|nr:hypothetical protein [Selenomonadaceae bacterium]